MKRRLPLLTLALALLSCGDAPPPPAAPPTAVARFAPAAEAPLDWGDVPFPSDLYRDAAGTIRIGALPTALTDAPIFAALREVFAGRDGFCATCNVHFVIDGPLDGSAIPRSIDAPSPGDPLLLADVDPTSPERGRLFPLDAEWNPATGVLALRPAPGIVLHRTRRYAAALTADLRAADGTALAPSEAFRRARDGDERGDDDPLLARVRAVVEPALAELEAIGVVRSSIVALAAFTTEDVTADLAAAHRAVQEGPPLEVALDRRWSGEELDELLGVPAEDRPGIDVPPAPGTAGTRAIVHATLAEALSGSFGAARLVTGSGTDIGTERRDARGEVEAGPREAVPFVLTIPAGADRTRLPIVIAHHGFNASRTTGFATAETAARVGVAVLAIDAFQHGDRAASARDELHAMRGDVPGPDGFAETTPADVSARIFGIAGAAPGLEGFPGYSHASLLQFAADVFSAVRLVREGALAAAVSEASGSALAFDLERIGFLGNSLGAVVGASVLVAEPELRAAVQNVPPGSIVETLAESPEFRPLVEALFLPRLGIEGPFDEVERRLLMDPIVDLSRWVLEPVDPLALAPYLRRDRLVPGPPPEVVFQVAALDEVVSLRAADAMLAANGADRVTRYDPAAHGMLEVVDQVSLYEPPVVPPFVRRAVPLPIRNPIEAVHAEIGDFLAATLATGR